MSQGKVHKVTIAHLSQLKLQASVDLNRFLVSQKAPNVLPKVRERDCPIVFRQHSQGHSSSPESLAHQSYLKLQASVDLGYVRLLSAYDNLDNNLHFSE